ncbi:LOW QUALITY PROTEIN: hypothetical protein HID58_018950 [Brassica napus]|uniref:Uncharacterized protein n=1 Tax=Brassica napus TaxID=3708 RepID=A0ABQ8DBG0_BRANA|nr:LOW QUALITY PROTEIN: hypothetical protein HID58_018950 [Brassica napus]
MDGTFLMLHSKLFDQGSFIKEKHWNAADSISHISIVYRTHLWVALFPSLKDLSVHGCQETPHVPELDLTHTRKLSNWVWSQFN